MTPWQNRVTEITQRMADDMLVRNLAQNTIDAYTYHVGRFGDFLEKPLDQATPEDVRSFQLHLIKVRKVGWSSPILFAIRTPRDFWKREWTC